MSNAAQVTKSVRMPDKLVDLMLTQLDNEPVDERKKAMRQHKRFPWRVPDMLIRMQQPGSANTGQFYAHTRNISAGGVAFLHGGFVHNGTKVLAQPPRSDGMLVDILGKVVSCRYLERGIHEVCVAFDETIDPGQYCSAAVTYDFLLVEDDDAIARLAEHHLGLLNVEVSRARHGKEAVDRVTRRRFDCILMDMEMPIMNGWDAVTAIREQGYSGRIIAVTALNGPEDEQRCLEVGCNDYLAKPVMPTTFKKLVEQLTAHPIVSRFAEDMGMRDMICEWCENLPATLRKIREFQDSGDRIGMGEYLRNIRGTAGSFGYDLLGSQAEELEAVLDSGADGETLEHAIGVFLDACKRVEPPVRRVKKPGVGESGDGADAAAADAA